MCHAASWLRFGLVAVGGLALDLWSKHWAFGVLPQGTPPRIVIPHLLEFQTMLNKGALFGIGAGRTSLFLVASALALVLVLWMFSQTPRHRRLLHVALGAILAGALGNMYDRATVKLLDRPLPAGNRLVFVARTGTDERGTILREYPPGQRGAAFRMWPDRAHPSAYVVQQLPRGLRMRLNQPPREVGFVRDFLKIPTTVPEWGWIPARFRGKELWPWVFNVADTLLVVGVGVLAVHLWRDRRPQPRRPGETGEPAWESGSAGEQPGA